LMSFEEIKAIMASRGIGIDRADIIAIVDESRGEVSFGYDGRIDLDLIPGRDSRNDSVELSLIAEIEDLDKRGRRLAEDLRGLLSRLSDYRFDTFNICVEDIPSGSKRELLDEAFKDLIDALVNAEIASMRVHISGAKAIEGLKRNKAKKHKSPING